jgi:DNA-directed RNA polymerase subunit M/transcription elongation factor TFIIS
MTRYCKECGGILVVYRNKLTCSDCGLVAFNQRSFSNLPAESCPKKVSVIKVEQGGLTIGDILEKTLRELEMEQPWDGDQL